MNVSSPPEKLHGADEEKSSSSLEGSRQVQREEAGEQGSTVQRGSLPEETGEDASHNQMPQQQDAPEDQPHSVFGKSEKMFIVVMAALAALFSPLSANIYYPALNILAVDLDVSNTLINLTITSYLIFQGLAPTLIGNGSDQMGRRPFYLLCFVIYIGANIGLALQNNYAALFILRCLQSSGSSGTVALANAVVADLVTSAERGSYIGYVSIGALTGPAFGPVIGGLLCQYLGWRSVFWFLTIFAGLVVIIFILILPETCRKVVGNGSIPPQKWNLSVLTYVKLEKQRRAGTVDVERRTLSHRGRLNPLNAVLILFDKESGLVLFYAATIFTGFYMVLTSIPSQLQQQYGFNTLQIGLCYIPLGCGGLAAAFVMGPFSDWNFRRHAKMQGIVIDKQKQQDLTNFPIEVARLEVVLPLVTLTGITAIGYGWVLETQSHLSGTLILIFLMTSFMLGAFNGLSTLVVDLNRDSPGTATAAMNLARCLMGAGGVAAVIPIIDKIGIGWTSVVIAGMWLVCSPMVLAVMKLGPRWRREKREKEEAKKQKDEAPRQEMDGLEQGIRK